MSVGDQYDGEKVGKGRGSRVTRVSYVADRAGFSDNI